MDFCIVGLGNPGTEYQNTRHNAGFMFLDYLQSALGCPTFAPNKYNRSLETKTNFRGKGLLLLKPQTYMNLSGEALIRLRTEIEPQNFIIVYDDYALPVGSLRIRKKGSAGSHNGMKSIIQFLGTEDFPRLRIGIAPEHQVANSRNFVLGRLSAQEIILIEELFPRLKEAVEDIISGRIDKACAKFNRKVESKEEATEKGL